MGAKRLLTKMTGRYAGLPRELYFICIAQVINRFGDFVVPFLTLYLTSKLGFAASIAGIVVTVTSVLGMPAAILGGRAADLIGRKKVYMIAQLSAAVLLIPCAFTMNHIVTIICLMASSFCSSALRPAFMAMVTDVLPMEKRQEGFSLNYLSINIGVSLGPLVAGFLFNKYLPVFFIGDAITSFVAVLLIGINVKSAEALYLRTDSSGTNASDKRNCTRAAKTSDERTNSYSDNQQKNKYSPESVNEKREEKGFLHMLYERPQLLCFMLLLIAFDFVYSQHQFSIPLMLENIFAEKSSSYYGIMMSVNAVTVLAFTLLITTATEKLSQLSIMAISGIMYAIGFGGICLVTSLFGLIIFTIVWTCGEIMQTISSGVYVAANSPVNYRARIQSAISIIWLIGSSIGTALSGVLMDKIGNHGVGLILFILSLTTAAAMLMLKRVRSHRE